MLITWHVYGQTKQQLTPEEKVSKASKSVNPALQTDGGPISNLSSINLVSLFNDARAEIKMAFASGNSVFNVGVSQSFSKKPDVAKMLDLTGISKGTTLSFAFQTKTGIWVNNDPYIQVRDIEKIDIFKTGKTWNDLSVAEQSQLIAKNYIDLKSFATPLLFNFQFTTSRVAFDYIADTLATRPLASTQMNKSVSFGFSKFTSLDAFWALTYNAIYTYQSGDNLVSYSFPIGGKGLTYAKDVTVGIPTEKFESKLKLEGRKILRNKARVAVAGINPSISMLFRAEKVNIDMPVYFLTRGDNGILNGLQAGFRVGYTSKADDSFFRDLGSFNSDKMYFSLFLSKPFSMQ